MIDRQAAAQVATAFIATIPRSEKAGPLALREDLTIERPFGWVFFYNFQRFLETKELRFAANGNAPIIVDRLDGSVHVTGTARPVAVYVEQYERRRRDTDVGGGNEAVTLSDMPQPARIVFTSERRRALLDECFALQQRLEQLGNLIERASGSEAQKLIDEEKIVWRRCSDLKDEYTAGVPVMALSRCPFTDQTMQHSIDHFGLDGLWWSYHAACRPVEQMPATYFAMAGALQLAGPPPWFPFLCRPGPEVPFVVPRILRHPAVKAVLSTGSIGEHQGYAITYFAKPIPYDFPRINTWGAHSYKFIDENGQIRLGSEPDNPSDMDFDLAPWISNGKLLWIAPGDTTLTLRDTESECPYLGLDGSRKITCIHKGKVWW